MSYLFILIFLLEELIAKKDLPQTSSRFETDCKGFKNNNDKLYFYVKVFWIILLLFEIFRKFLQII